MKDASIGYGCFVVSVVVHGAALLRDTVPEPPPRLFMDLELAAPAPASKPAPLPPPKPARQPKLAPLAKAASPKPLATVPATLAANPPPEPELSGKTLVADAGSFAAPAGNGAERDGALVGVGRGPSSVALAKPAQLAAALPQLTQPLAELSRKPSPPSLAAALARNFPAAARAQGKSGEAKVRVMIDARGRAASVTLSSESSPGFGAACQKTLLQSQWSPPLGKRGEPTATFVTYRCRFQVDD